MSQASIAREANQRKPWVERTLFISGRVSLDLAQSGGSGPYSIFERLREPDDLAEWLLMSELAVEVAEISQADLRRAKRLRTAIWQAANQLREGEQPDQKDIKRINAMAQAAPLTPVYDPQNGGQSWREPAKARAALASIARDAIDLFAHQHESPIQQCQGNNCPLLFVDHSRAGKRRWCAMERCGNRAKVAKFRRKAG